MLFDTKSFIIFALGLALLGVSAALFVLWRRARSSGQVKKNLSSVLTEFQRQFQCFPLPAYIWRANGDDFTLIGYNRAAQKFTEGTIEKIQGSSARKLYSDDPAVYGALVRAYAERTAFVIEGPYQMRVSGLMKQLRVTYSYAPDEYVIVYTEDYTDRHNAMETLKASKSRLRASLDSSQDAVFILEAVVDSSGKTADFQVIDRNLAALKISPHACSEIVGLRMQEAFPEFYERGFVKDYEQVFQTQQPRDWEYQTVAADGTQKWFCQRVTPTQTGIVIVNGEITRWKQAEQETAARNAELARLEHLLNLITDAIHVADESGNLIYINDAAAKRFGIDKKDIGKHTVRSYSEIFRGEGAWEKHIEHLKGVSHLTAEGKHHDLRTHQTYEVEVTSLYVRFGGEGYAVAVSRDIGERRRAEAAMRASQAQLSLIADNVPGLIGYWTKDEKCGFANRNYLEWYGRPDLDKATMTMRDILGDKFYRESQPFIQRALAGERVSLERELPKPDGQKRFVWLNYIPDADPQGGYRGFFVLGTDISELKNAELALRESQQHYQAVVNASRDAIVIHQSNEIVFVNDACVRLLGGESPEQFLGHSPLEFIHPDYHEIATERMLRVELLNETVPLLEKKFVRLDGSVIEVEVSAALIEFQGKAASLIVARDMTERRRTESYLRLLQTSIANISDIVLITEADKITEPGPRIVFVNEAFERITGYLQAEVLGKSPRFLQGPLTDRGELKRIRQALETRQRVRAQLVNYRKDGSMFWLEVDISPIYNEVGVCTHFVSIERDITRRKEEEVQRNAHMHRIANLERALDAHSLVAVTDSKGRILYANDKFTKISGYSREELIAQDHRILNSGYHSKAFFRDMWRTIRSGQIWKNEIRNRAKDGSFYWVDTTIVPMMDEAGEISEYVSIRTEVSERIRYQKMINELNINLTLKADELKKANVSLESFAYSVAHDLRAPLRGIDGWSYALKEDYAAVLDATGLQYLDRIRSDAQKMGAMIDVFLRLVRLTHDKVKVSTVNLADMALDIAKKLQRENPDRVLRFEIHKDLLVSADPQFLEVALANLLQNAVKFTRSRAEAVIEVGRLNGKDGAVYFVRDNGVGFDAVATEEVGQSFKRRHSASEYPGTGVGLTIVRRVIDRHGGKIWVESKPDQGATYFFTLGINPGSLA